MPPIPPLAKALLRRAEHAVVVTVSIVDMMQVAGNEVVGMAAVLHRFVPTAIVVLVGGFVGAASVRWGAGFGVGFRNGHGMLVHVVLVWVMQVALVQVVGVAIMQHGGMAAIGAVLVGVISVNMVLRIRLGHDLYPLSKLCRQADPRPPGR